MLKIAIILGTRPEIIKMSSIIRECKLRQLDYFILHTGQHYDYEMDKEFFEDLDFLFLLCALLTHLFFFDFFGP